MKIVKGVLSTTIFCTEVIICIRYLTVPVHDRLTQTLLKYLYTYLLHLLIFIVIYYTSSPDTSNPLFLMYLLYNQNATPITRHATMRHPSAIRASCHMYSGS
jgi:hypothetical protein